MAAYSRLANRSQAKFQTMKLSPLSAPCAAAPVQSTVSTCRSLRFSPRSRMDVNLTRTVPVAFPRHFSKQETKSVGGCLPCLSVCRKSGRSRHIWHKRSFIQTCVKSRSLPVTKARWQNHVTDLRWVQYSWSHGSASQCDGPSRMTTRQGSAAQVPDSAKDDGSSRRVTSQQGGTTWKRMTRQRSWTTQQAWLTQHMMMTTQQALLTQHMMMTTQQALLTQHMMMTTLQALLTQHMTTREVVDSPHHQDLAMDGPVEILAPEEVLQLPAKRSSDGSSKSKRAMTTTSYGSKATEVEQSAVRPSRSRQPKKSVASSVSVVGQPSSDGSERHRSRSGYRRQGVTSQLSRVPQQGTLQLQERIHPCYLMSAVCSARQWPSQQPE